MDTTLVVSILCTIVYSKQQEKLFFLFQKRVVARRLPSELVVSMMDKLSGINIPSDSNDDKLESGDGETVTYELHQLSTISCTFPLIAWCAQ